MVSPRFLRETRALPLSEDDAEVALAMADPTDDYAIGAFRMVTGRTVRPMVAIRRSSRPRWSGCTAPASPRRAR